MFVCFWHLNCLRFSEIPESVVLYLTLIWENFSVIIVLNIYSASFFFLLPIFSFCIFCPFVIVPQPLDNLSCYFQSLLSSTFQSERFLLIYPQAWSFFLSCIQSTNSLSMTVFVSIRVILFYFFKSLASLHFSLGVSISLLPLPSVLACRLVYPLEPLA